MFRSKWQSEGQRGPLETAGRAISHVDPGATAYGSRRRKPVVVLRRFSGALTPRWGRRKDAPAQTQRSGWGPNYLRVTLDAHRGHGGTVRGAVRGKQGIGGSKPGPPPSS